MSKGIFERISDFAFGSGEPARRYHHAPRHDVGAELVKDMTEVLKIVIELRTKNAALEAENAVLREQLNRQNTNA